MVNHPRYSSGAEVVDDRISPLVHIALFIIAAAIFGSSANFDFTLDDRIHIVNNPSIRTLSEISSLLYESMFPGNLYRPLVTFSYALTYNFVGLDPLSYHVTNIILHALVCCLLLQLLVHIVPKEIAITAAFLFAVHPVHTEAVVNISGRAELFSTLLGLLTLLLARHFCTDSLARNAFASLAALFIIALSFLLALLSKESAFVCLLLLPLALAFGRSPVSRLSRLFAVVIALAFSSAAYLALRIHALGSVFGNTRIDFIDNPIAHLAADERIGNALYLMFRYYILALAPSRLSADYSYAATQPIQSWDDGKIVTALLILTLLFILACVPIGKGRNIRFFLLWFFASFAVTANIFFPIGTVFADRLLYLPSVGVIGVVASALLLISADHARHSLALGLFAVCALKAYTYQQHWIDNHTLFTHQAKVSPESLKTKVNYGVVLRDAGRLKEAKQQFNDAFVAYPPYADAAFGLATVALKTKNTGEAQSFLTKALEANPYHVPSLVALARVHLNSQRPEEAEKLVVRALQINKDNIDALITKYALAVNRKDKVEALALRHKLLAVAPGHRDLDRINKLFKVPE